MGMDYGTEKTRWWGSFFFLSLSFVIDTSQLHCNLDWLIDEKATEAFLSASIDRDINRLLSVPLVPSIRARTDVD